MLIQLRKNTQVFLKTSIYQKLCKSIEKEYSRGAAGLRSLDKLDKLSASFIDSLFSASSRENDPFTQSLDITRSGLKN